MSEKDESLREEVDLEIPYVLDDGTQGIKKVHIAFISQQISYDYFDLKKEANEALTLAQRINNIASDMGYATAKANLENKGVSDIAASIEQGVGKLKKETDAAVARITEIANHTFEKKMALIRKILKKNGITDTDLYDSDWWMNNVDMSTMMSFITCACEKDDFKIESKKKEQK